MSSEDGGNPYNISEIKPLINQTGEQAYGFFPDFSPDGEEITFLCGISGKIGVWVMDIDGNNSRVLYANRSIDYDFGPPRFSPDGDKIVFISHTYNKTTKEETGYINIILKENRSWIPSSSPETVYKIIDTEKNGYPMFPSWSPDGKKIIFEVFFAFNSENHGIWTIDADGSNLTQIAWIDEGASFPSYSPDGSKILYMPFGPHGEHEIWIMNSDRTNRHRILDESWYPDQARFTPDGRIIFTSARVSPHSDEVSPPNIWMMDQDGGNKVMLVPTYFNHDVGCETPVMSPDMHRLLFFHGLSNRSGLFYIDDPTGEWKDSDGDGVYDGIDGAPHDPYMGYIGENPTMSWAMKNMVLIAMGLSVVVAAVLTVVYIIRKKKGGKSEHNGRQ